MRILPDIQVPDFKALIPAKPVADTPEDPDIELSMATIVTAFSLVMLLIVGISYMSSVTLDQGEKNVLLNTLLISDSIIFCAAVLSVAFLWYLSSAFYGNMESRSPLHSKTLAICGGLVLLPLIFIACDLAFKPQLFAAFDAWVSMALSVLAAASIVVMLAYMATGLRPRSMIDDMLADIERDHASAGLERSIGSESGRYMAVQAASRLEALMKKLYTSGDLDPVYEALEKMGHIALAPKAPFNDQKAVSLSSTAVSLMAESGIESAKSGCYEVTRHVIDDLFGITESSAHRGISSLAFRYIGSIYVLCTSRMSEPDLAKLENKLISSYASLFDHTGRRESLDLAAAMLDKAMTSKTFTQDEHNHILYLAAGVYRRLADADGSEEYANRALTILYEALTASQLTDDPIAYAMTKIELGKAYLALGKAKGTVKSYRGAAEAFEEAGNALTAETSPWDVALCHGKAAYAYTLMAEEYSRTKKYDDALEAAKKALALYGDSANFFTQRRSAEENALLMANLGTTHTIVCEVFARSRMFDESLKHAQFALTAYSSAAKAANLSAIPERYAAMRVSMGQTYVTMAEINFREQHYESAISACDSSIAAYNEALRIFEEKGMDKQATTARKHLKKANDLFNTMLRIGVADKKPEPAPLLLKPKSEGVLKFLE